MPTADAQNIFNTLMSIVPFIALIVVFYFFMIRPQRKKEKQVKQMLSEMKKGDRVTTIGGIYGTISSIKDDVVTLEVGSGAEQAKLMMARWAIKNVENGPVENDQQLPIT